MLALVECVPVADGPKQAPNTPYQKGDPNQALDTSPGTKPSPARGVNR